MEKQTNQGVDEMRDYYGDKIFTIMPREHVKKDTFRIRLEDSDPVMRQQRDWFRNTQHSEPVTPVKLKSFAQLRTVRR